MENIEYANAYSEVLEILKHISKKDYNKIPKQKIELFETNANKSHEFTYDPNKTLDEQNVSKVAKTIIAILFRDCWATDSQREKIIAKEKYDRIQIEEQTRAQYNPDDIFKKKEVQKSQLQTEENDANLPIEVRKDRFYHKFINFIKRVFSF